MSDDYKNISWPGWETVGLIGRGSFGAVYELQRDVFGDIEKAALKVISIPQNASDIDEMYSDGYDDESITSTFQSHLKSIVAEYSLMRKMNGSANIVNCDDIRYVQHDDGIGWDIFIKMELLTPLTKALPSEIPEETVVKIAKDMCSALELCKKHGIVHRDIKPQNIFVSANGDYKLGDFGIAKTVEKTMGGTKIGTYKYMAPEVYNNQPYGSATDIYSLGLVLYWMLNERRMPFLPLPPEKLKAGMEEEARYRRFKGEPLPPPAHGSETLKAVVLKACAYDPKDRYHSAQEMLTALNTIDSMTQPVPQPTPQPVLRPQPTPTSAPSSQPEPTPQPAPSSRPEPAPAPLPDGKKSKKTKLALLCLSVVVIAAVVLFFALRTPNISTGNPHQSAQTTHKPTSTPKPTATPKPTSSSQSAQWSEWMDTLPANINTADYTIENRTLYRKRELQTTSSTSNTMAGWELYDTVYGTGNYGLWSDWSDNYTSSSNTRQVETQTKYRYRDKETTSSNSANLSGWDLEYSTSEWGAWGSWSGWSTNSVSKNDSRDVETDYQYRYRIITVETENAGWGNWGSWQDEYIASDAYTDVQTRDAYHYYYYLCDNCGAHMHGYGTCYTWAGGCGGKISRSSYHKVRYETAYKNAKDWHGTGVMYARGDDGLGFAYTSKSSEHYVAPITQYRCRTMKTYDTVVYSPWSEWSFSSYAAGDGEIETESRKVYRYRDRNQIFTYHYSRWGSWSSWSTSAVSATSTKQVETATYYRYRDKTTTITYYFRRWSEWSDYTTNKATASDTVDVQTKMQYRYKAKT